MEVRLPMAQAAMAMQQSAGLKNLHFMWGNVNINFARLAASLPQGTSAVERVRTTWVARCCIVCT